MCQVGGGNVEVLMLPTWTWKGNATEAEDFGREGAHTYALQSRIESSWQEAEITSTLFLCLWKWVMLSRNKRQAAGLIIFLLNGCVMQGGKPMGKVCIVTKRGQRSLHRKTGQWELRDLLSPHGRRLGIVFSWRPICVSYTPWLCIKCCLFKH